MIPSSLLTPGTRVRGVIAAVAVSVIAAAFPSYGASVFPYKVEKRTLPNGLDVIVIETAEFKDVVNLNTMIIAGSRNEIEKGKSGLAHLFEHIAFRHRYEDPARAYQTQMDEVGAFNNAWTWFDVTYYHPVTFASNFERLVELEAERFVAMDFSERIYRTEAGAVLGEYRRNASDPSLRMEEVINDLAYGPSHGYGHTTIGYLPDVNDMPASYKAGRAFYETYYRPNNAVVLVTGDVKAARAFELIERHYGSWKKRPVPELPDPKPLQGPKRGQFVWESDVPPRIDFAYQVPAFDPGSTESSVIELLPELVSGNTAPLFQRLRYQKKLATDMVNQRALAEGLDRRLFETFITVEKNEYDRRGSAVLTEIENEMIAGLDELKKFSTRPDAAKTLAALKSKFRYDLLAALSSPKNIGETFALYYRFDRDPAVLDTLVDGVDGLTPQDIDSFATRHFTPSNRVVVTMTPRKGGSK